MTPSLFYLGMFFGCLGMGYCVYGRRQRALIPFLCGLLLIVVPYFISNSFVLVAAGVALAALPFFTGA